MFFAIIIAVLHFVALKFYLYWTSPIDIPMHIIGGALVSLIGLYVIYFSPWKKYYLSNSKRILFLSVFIAFTVGLFWEIFELSFGIISYSFIDRVDSIKDLLNDTIGALIVGLYFVNNLKK
jgi:hypothetical protein